MFMLESVSFLIDDFLSQVDFFRFFRTRSHLKKNISTVALCSNLVVYLYLLKGLCGLGLVPVLISLSD